MIGPLQQVVFSANYIVGPVAGTDSTECQDNACELESENIDGS